MELLGSAGVVAATAVDRGRHSGGPSGLAEGRPECRSDGARPSFAIPEVVRELNVRTDPEAETAPQASQPAGTRVARGDVFVFCGLRSSR
jgi:hypothetical protein